MKGKIVKFILGIGESTGLCVQENERSVVVRLKNGAMVKRHKEKHMVRVTS